MHGRLEVQFERRGDKTLARILRQAAPLKVLKAFYPEDESIAHLYILNSTGGILQGDRMEIKIHLAANAEAVVLMPAATKIHPCPSGDARQTMRFRLDAGAVLEYLPEPLLPFSEAVFFQETDIFLEAGASLFFGDILGPGRLAKGESFAYRLFENRMKIRDVKGLIVQESFQINPAIRAVNGLGVMADKSHLGSLYVICPDNKIEALLKAFRGVEQNPVDWGTSLLSRRGLFVRALAFETPLLQALFSKLWGIFREIVLGRSLPPVRRY
ncbi:hypothetical protein MNBD_NITROSPIRAE01-125 [hydrothermal vent metagenome]|uniref:Urease accessory protein UreD n=1 Tax=hydrothermal vent metagenome TaxID=652676 RepID=A0A3B1D9R8_9ZZZZ